MKIKIYHRFSKIKATWKALYEQTPQVSPFLDPEAMSIAARYFYPYYLTQKCYPLFVVFFDVLNNPIGACALVKYLKGKTQLFGFPNGFNESGFVYISTEILPDCLQALKHKFKQVEFLKIDERSPISEYRDSSSKSSNNVAISFGDNFENYFKTLSASVRQNVRTAYNRLKKDGLSFTVSFIEEGNKLDTNAIVDLYCNRHSERYGVITSPLKRWFLKSQSFATRYYRYSPNAITVILYINGQLAAFLSGLWSRDRLIVPRLSINSDFKRYSPGVILICEAIKLLIERTNVRILDLSLGEEQYKLQLGGEIHKSYSWLI